MSNACHSFGWIAAGFMACSGAAVIASSLYYMAIMPEQPSGFLILIGGGAAWLIGAAICNEIWC